MESIVVVTRVCREIAAVTGLDEGTQTELTKAVSDTERWLAGQAEVRRELFLGLEEAVAAGNIEQVRQLMVRADATASHDRTDAESAIAAEASEHLAVLARQRQAAAAARLAEREGIEAGRAARHVQMLLMRLEKGGLGPKTMRKVVQDLAYAAVEAHDHIDAHQQEQISSWKARAGIGRRPTRAERATRPKRKPPLHEKVGRDRWLKKPCPRCHAAKDKECTNDDKGSIGRLRRIPHDERLQLIINGRKDQAEPNTQRPRSGAVFKPSAVSARYPEVRQSSGPSCRWTT
ncbi:zinc finger domain-containing protein [Streptomyces sp. NPDC002540]